MAEKRRAVDVMMLAMVVTVFLIATTAGRSGADQVISDDLIVDGSACVGGTWEF